MAHGKRKPLLKVRAYLCENLFWMSFSAAVKNSSSSNSVGIFSAVDDPCRGSAAVGCGRRSLEGVISLLLQNKPHKKLKSASEQAIEALQTSLNTISGVHFFKIESFSNFESEIGEPELQ